MPCQDALVTRTRLSDWRQLGHIARDRTRTPRVRARRALKLRRPPGTVVVLYHRVQEAPGPADAIDVTRFAEQLHALQQLGDMVPLAELALPAGRAPPATRPRIAVTFDDGYTDNAEIALPLLERHGIPATFFVTTAAFDDPTEFWWDRLEHLLLDEQLAPPPSVEVAIRGRRIRFDLTDGPQRGHAYQRLNWELLYATPEEIEDVIAEIEHACGRRCEPCGRHARLSPSQIRAAAGGGVATIGAHTVHHHCLSALPDNVARDESTQSRAALAEVIGDPPSFFAYPFGDERSFGRRDRRMAEDAGFDLAVAAVPSARTVRDDRWRVPRISAGGRSPDELRSLVRPFLH